MKVSKERKKSIREKGIKDTSSKRWWYSIFVFNEREAEKKLKIPVGKEEKNKLVTHDTHTSSPIEKQRLDL